jgi:protein SCO1/2
MRSTALTVGVILYSFLAGCGEPAASHPRFNSTEVASAEFGRDFQLTDQTGRSRRLSDFLGQVVAVFFGYTHCPDACPMALGDLAIVTKRLGDEGKRLQVIFVTLDPERDTQAVLRRYVPAFNPGFLGLYADADVTRKVASDFKVLYEKVPGTLPGRYEIDHPAYIYAFDPKGRLRILMSPTETVEQKLEDIRALLAGA